MKRLFLVYTVFLLLFAATAVSAGGNAEQGKSIEEKKEPVNLRVWFTTRQPIVEMTKGYIEQFEADHPWITIDFMQVKESDMLAKFTTALLAGNQPDVTYIDEIILDAMVNGDQLRELPVDESWVSLKMGPKVAQRFKVKGSYYVLPNGSMTSLLYYNKAHLASVGAGRGDIPRKWEQFIPFAKRVAEANGLKTAFAFKKAEKTLFQDLTMQFGGTRFLNSEKSLVGSEPAVRAAQWIVDLYDTHKVASRDSVGAREAFGAAQAPFAFEWSWFIGMLQGTYPDVEFGTSPLPTPDGTPPYGRYGDNAGFSVTYTDRKNREAAELFWKTLMTTDFHRRFAMLRGLVSAHLEVRESDLYVDQPYDVPKDIIAGELAVNDGDPPSEVTSSIGKAVSAIVDGGAEVRKTLKDAEAKIDSVLAEMDNWLLWGAEGLKQQ